MGSGAETKKVAVGLVISNGGLPRGLQGLMLLAGRLPRDYDKLCPLKIVLSTGLPLPICPKCDKFLFFLAHLIICLLLSLVVFDDTVPATVRL